MSASPVRARTTRAVLRSVPSPRAQDVSLDEAFRAVRSFSPSWPLDSFVAVNPFLESVRRPYAEAVRHLATSRGARAVPSRETARSAIEEQRIEPRHLAASLRTEGSGPHVSPVALELHAKDGGDEVPFAAHPTVTSVLGAKMGIDLRRVVSERLASTFSAYFDRGQAQLSAELPSSCFEAYLDDASVDLSLDILVNPGLRRKVASSPRDPEAIVRSFIETVGLDGEALEACLAAALEDVAGWTSYARYLDWQAGRREGVGSVAFDVLAARLAFELALLDLAPIELRASLAAASRDHFSRWDGRATAALARDVALQRAHELATHERTARRLASSRRRVHPGRFDAQMVFCIDVRSEPMRRAIESALPRVETLGFAGFFGLPLGQRGPNGSESLCPVLLEPALELSAPKADDRSHGPWKAFKRSAVSSFSFVSSFGLGYMFDMAVDYFALATPKRSAFPTKEESRPSSLEHVGPDGSKRVLTENERCSLAERVLRAMSLTRDFARQVVFVGHGGTSANNPHAAGLDCGACGGHSGTRNAVALATLLSERSVREGLHERGIVIPEDTVFLAATHDTTTDEIFFVAPTEVESTRGDELRALRDAIASLRDVVQRERSSTLGSAESALRQRRSRDWSCVRPEWGLAGCTAFVAAARGKVRSARLDGGAFLHTYDWRDDRSLGTLELILTAPVVVASWINLQYFGSVVDPKCFGAGDKTSHNVVGKIGVVEGAHGDLRVGLPLQSVHDGERFVHRPVKLGVFVQAPQSAIETVLDRHDDVRALFVNGWLSLYSLDDDMSVGGRYLGPGSWESSSVGE